VSIGRKHYYGKHYSDEIVLVLQVEIQFNECKNKSKILVNLIPNKTTYTYFIKNLFSIDIEKHFITEKIVFYIKNCILFSSFKYGENR
jgi:hypothetical protein